MCHLRLHNALSFILKLTSGSLLQNDAYFSELRVSDPAELSGVSEEGVKITAKSPSKKEKRVFRGICVIHKAR